MSTPMISPAASETIGFSTSGDVQTQHRHGEVDLPD
jgi:hypothetical protein